jgi:tRNA G18 (ribose-2'-O)-methylase SpoU
VTVATRPGARIEARAIRIDDAGDPRLADYVGVREPALVRDRGLVLIEGRFVVRRLLAAGTVQFVSLLLNDAAFRSLADVLDDVDERVPVYLAPPAILAGVTGFNIHRGCLAVAERPPEISIEALSPGATFVVILERVIDTDNVGVVFRNAEAFGVDAVLLSPGGGDPFYRKAIRTSSGATLMVPSGQAAPWPDVLEALGAAGFTTVALAPDAGGLAIGEFVTMPRARGRVALLLGTEGEGLSAAALARADVRVTIPMCQQRGRIGSALDSLNIATAAGIALHRLHEVRTRTVEQGG